jgi:hypothetical protein
LSWAEPFVFWRDPGGNAPHARVSGDVPSRSVRRLAVQALQPEQGLVGEYEEP